MYPEPHYWTVAYPILFHYGLAYVLFMFVLEHCSSMDALSGYSLSKSIISNAPTVVCNELSNAREKSHLPEKADTGKFGRV